MREDDILNAIVCMPSDRFERFARELVRRELYHGLNPTSESYDLGEDARTELSTVFMHGGKRISLAISKTTSLSKITADCKTIQANERPVDVIVYITDEDIRTDVEEEWRSQIRSEFGWELEMRTPRWLAPVASQPVFESLVDDYLHIPPPGGDYVQTIQREFTIHSTHTLNQISDKIPGLSTSLPRREISTIEEQLASRIPVLLTGGAGTGKSAIGAQLALNAIDAGKAVLLVDARSIGHLNTELDLRAHLGLHGSVHSAILRIGKHIGCRLIVDQLDNLVGTPAANLVIDMVLNSISASDQIDVVVISRNQEKNEGRLLSRLFTGKFIELSSSLISETTVINVFDQIGIKNYTTETVELGRNLLNLELIGKIQEQLPGYDFRLLTSEVFLWEQYMEILIRDEDSIIGDQILAEAVRLAKHALSTTEGTFELPYPLLHSQQRLISWGIITPVESRIHRFRHERFQEFIYAWDATQKLALPRQVISEITPYRSQNIFRWMDAIYLRNNSSVYAQFLREAFDV
jgi:hypothetical protein